MSFSTAQRVLCFAALLSSVAPAHSALQILTFEDLEGDPSVAIANGYGGLNWTGPGFAFVGADNVVVFPRGAGYAAGQVTPGGEVVAFNGFAFTPSAISAPPGMVFDFISAYWTAAFTPQTLTLEGFLNGTRKYDPVLVDVNASGPTFQEVNWNAIDTLRISVTADGTPRQWVLDQFAYTIPVPVPEPQIAAFLLAGVGLLALTRRWRRRAG
jgi:hypothetical protein